MTAPQHTKPADIPVYALFAALFWLPVAYVAAVFFALPHPDGIACVMGEPCMAGAVYAMRDLWWVGFAILAVVFWPFMLRQMLAVHIVFAAAACRQVRRTVVCTLELAGLVGEKRHA